MNKIFRRFLKNYTKGDEEKELWLWDLFYNYEVSIGVAIALALCIIAYLIIGLFAGINVGFSKVFELKVLLMVTGIPLLCGLFVAGAIVSPLNESDGEKQVRKENVKQGSLFLATAIGHIANFIVDWGPLLLLVVCIMSFNWILILGSCVGVLLYYLILGLVKSNAKDYVKWRFNWAIENYEMLFSGHYKWWTSAADMSVQKFNLKKFQNYKYHATLSLIMIPLMGTIFLFSAAAIGKDAVKKTEQIQATTDSISTPDVVDNTLVNDESNVEVEQQESVEPDEFRSSDENLSDDSRYNDYDEYEDRPSQSMTSSDPKSETKPKTEAVTRANDQASTPPAAPVREERQDASQAEQTPKANAGPEFQGGNYALSSYIARHINYPPAAAEKKIQGKVVVKLTISSTGQVSNAEIVQSVDPMLDAEALRLCKSLPRFTPARRNGQPVASTMTIPINFRL